MQEMMEKIQQLERESEIQNKKINEKEAIINHLKHEVYLYPI